MCWKLHTADTLIQKAVLRIDMATQRSTGAALISADNIAELCCFRHGVVAMSKWLCAMPMSANTNLCTYH